MADIHLDYEDMRRRATQLTQKEDFIKSELRSMQSEIQNLLDSGFQTQVSSGAFGERFGEFKTQADTIIGTMTDLSGQLNQIVSNFSELDTSGA